MKYSKELLNYSVAPASALPLNKAQSEEVICGYDGRAAKRRERRSAGRGKERVARAAEEGCSRMTSRLS